MNPVQSMAWLLEIGFNPTREALMAQGSVLLLALITFLLWRRNISRAPDASPS
jgi:hypothetical protein